MWRRLLVFGCAASASLALASGAPAKTPQLLVSGATEIGASAATVIRVKEEKTHAAPFRTSMSLVVQGATFDVPAYVDPATGNDATFSSAKIVLCLSNPYEQAGPGTRAPFGVRFIVTRMTLSAGVFTNPIVAGSFVWRAVITPWTANAAAEDATGTIEAQSIVNIPSSLSRTTGLATRMTLKATATVPTRETDCANPLPVTAAPAGCVAATIAGYKLSSNTVTAMPKKR